MDLDLVAQQARTIKEVYSQYLALLNQKREQMIKGMVDAKLEDKIEQTREYLLKVIAVIQRGVDEERENVFR